MRKLSQQQQIKNQVVRYLSFWPYYLISCIIAVISVFLFLRYTPNQYRANAKIEIIDKAQDSEMALPTSMTVFNRSMVNLENEISVIQSFSLHQVASSRLKSNVKYFSLGTIKTTENEPDSWFRGYDLKFNISTDSIDKYSFFEIKIDPSENSNMTISGYDANDNLTMEYSFSNNSTFTNPTHKLPFDLIIKENISEKLVKRLAFYPFKQTVHKNINSVTSTPYGKLSDQLIISITGENRAVISNYLNTLIDVFNEDGIYDRQLGYQRTVKFVDERAKILSDELEIIENKRQLFKEVNSISDISTSAETSISQKFLYSNELSDAKTQRQLVEFLKSTIKNNESTKTYELLPIEVGLNSSEVNNSITQYNSLVIEKDKYSQNYGQNNPYIKSVVSQLDKIIVNLLISIDSYLASIDIQIANLESKESEYTNAFNSIPKNEKILRSIERELEIKEALFLLMLQKKEEASINFAVIKPSIKVIDYAISNPTPVYPNTKFIYSFSIIASLFIPVLFVYIRFLLDTKIHTKDDLDLLLNYEIPIVAEIPFIRNKKELNIVPNQYSRGPLIEAFRMAVSNLNFTSEKTKADSKSILVTSSIKGEGKTISAVNIANIYALLGDSVCLVGCDLRNPQIHKFYNLDKNHKGVSDILYRDELKYDDLVISKNEEFPFDTILSGTIPPNPKEILSSKKFRDLINLLKDKYDVLIIDTAPCLLVSDTLSFSELVDESIYVFRSNFTESNLSGFILDLHNNKKLNKMSIMFNGVGTSDSYGYKYGYQYGYKYGYKYGYNYGYGYGYGQNDKD